MTARATKEGRQHPQFSFSLRVRQRWLFATSFIGVMAALSATNNVAADEFTVLAGQGTEVCDAYARRLNQTDFSTQVTPHCGRPEDTSVTGFSPLTRVRLSFAELQSIGDQLLGFYSHNDQDYAQKLRAAQLASCDQPGREKQCEQVRSDKQRAESQGDRWLSWLNTSYMQAGQSFAWRYEPPIDIDNDATPDPILLFRQRCDGVRTGGTYAFVMTDDSYLRVDESRTRQIFGHPNPVWPGVPEHKAFRPLGGTFGAFSYRGQQYFDTFFQATGDDEDRRIDDPTVGSILAVFHRKDRRTRKLCEIRWSPPSRAPLN